ncbi:hypothetical protein PAXRUDRAFT_825454, partial [Paxillus rubicundulus Ve08.2h10]
MFSLTTTSSKTCSELVFLEARWLTYNGRKAGDDYSMSAEHSLRKYRTEDVAEEKMELD